jgi:hypothetical protein
MAKRMRAVCVLSKRFVSLLLIIEIGAIHSRNATDFFTRTPIPRSIIRPSSRSPSTSAIFGPFGLATSESPRPFRRLSYLSPASAKSGASVA